MTHRTDNHDPNSTETLPEDDFIPWRSILASTSPKCPKEIWMRLDTRWSRVYGSN